MNKQNIGYITANFLEKEKIEIINWSKIINNKDLYFAKKDGKIDGGNVTDDLHLTLFYGLDEDKINKNYIEIYTPTENYIIREKLKILLQRLNFDDLYRIHRRFAVNINHVDKIDAQFVYVNNQSLPISKTYQAELLIKNCIQIKG